MDREKSKVGAKRGTNKVKPTLFPPGDFIALGSKSSRGPSEVPEPKSQSKTSVSTERKRDSSSPSISSASLPKKSKLANSPSSSLASPLVRSGSQGKRDSVKSEVWDSVATDVEPTELLAKILEAEEQNEDEKAEALVCGAVKSLRNSRSKPEASQFLALMFLAKTRPNIFASDLVVDAFCSLLKRDVTANFKSKGNNLISLLACNILLSAYHETVAWPDEFVKMYIEDSLGERIWVDNEECKGFVNNLLTAFGTILPPKSLMAPELTFKPDACPSPPTGLIEDDDASSSSLSLECRESLENITIIPRYKHNRDAIEKYVLDAVHEHLARKQPMEVSRNMLRLLISTCGLSEIRLLVAQKLEIWLQNPKLTRPAQDLLSAICLNCTQHSQQDVEVIAQLIRIRLKSKPIINHFLQCMKELLKKHAENLSTVLKHSIYNELSTSRNPNNMQLLAIIFQHAPEKSAKVLAEVFLDLLTKRDDYLRALRVLFREIVRTIRHDLNYTSFCLALMQERRDQAFRELEAPLKERMMFSIVDIGVLAIFMCISPLVREAASSYSRGEKKGLAGFMEILIPSRVRSSNQSNAIVSLVEISRERQALAHLLLDLTLKQFWISMNSAKPVLTDIHLVFFLVFQSHFLDLAVLRNFHNTVTVVQRDTVWWLHTIVPKMYNPGRNEFLHCINKILFMEQLEHYYNKDNWPPEGDRHILLRLATEMPVLEDTIIRILVIGLSRDHPLTANDALDLSDHLIKRAASIHSDDLVVLKFDKEELFELIFKLCAYHHPENISLPAGYKPPSLAISDLYWKAWVMLLVIVAHNPSTFGLITWEQYPTLRNFMEMCVTNHFLFPPATVAAGEKADEIRSREIQIAQLEKQEILEFESHLAAASTKVAITESNSLLLSKLVMMDPLGAARRPPNQVLEQVKSLNQSFKLGHLLCRSRKPDFLLDIIQRQGTSQSMPWLAELVESSEGSFSMLPVQCLCEFLLNDPPTEFENLGDGDDDIKTEKIKAKKRVKQEQLLRHLQNALHNSGGSPEDSQSTKEVLDYFLRRLGSQQLAARLLAIKGLRMVLSQPNKSPEMSDDEDSVEKDKENDEFSWLLKSMPGLAHFDSVRAAASLALRQACQVENDPAAISAYVKFLAEFAPNDNLQDVSDLALDMAQLIVERPTIVNCIVPPPPNPCVKEYPFLTAVTSIFIRYLRMAKIPSREAYSWSESQDHILVQWAGGEAATMRILVVHAMVIILTYGPPVGDQSHFKELLDTWFPIDTPPPQAFLVDTSEEALLQPDWLKLRMIRSSVEILVDSALKDLDPGQLVLFVQSFGIPVYTMSKLLLLLDLAVQIDSYSVDQAIVDKKYMAQLVEVQHQRGATGGDQFARLLGDYELGGVPVITISESVNTTSVIQKTPSRTLSTRLPTPQLEPQMVQIALLQLFKLTEEKKLMEYKTPQELFKVLQKCLSQDILLKRSDHPYIAAFADACYGITRGPLRENFASSVLQKTNYSSVLFRLSTAAMTKKKPERGPTTEKLLDVCRSICLCAKNVKSPLTTILKQFMKGFDDGCFDYAHKDRWRLLMEDLLSSKTEWNSRQVVDIIRAVAKGNKHRLEEVTLEIVKAGIQQGKVHDLLEALTSIVMNSNLTPEMSRYHLFVDLISQLDPEVIGQRGDAHRERQQQLLFSKEGSSSSENPFPFRPFLLALLIHQSNWQTLQECVVLVLRRNDPGTCRYDPSSVLDFLWACIHIPKIWQGKDKRKPKHHKEEDVLALSQDQLISVADYIVSEALSKLDPKETDLNNLSVDPIVAYRLPLLVRCCCLVQERVSAVAHHLLELTLTKSITNANPKHIFIVKQLLLQMYLEMPSIFRFNSLINQVLDQAETLLLNCSKLDVISHTLLISMATTDSSKQCTERMDDLNLALRKLASCHPYLLLRQLPMIATLLQGRVQLDYIVFRARNHLTFFTNILGLLELLAPQILLHEFREDLSNIFNCYLDLFQTHSSQTSDLVSLFNRFLSFLKSCMAVAPSCVRPCIQKNLTSLQELPQPYQDLAVFKALLAGTSWMHRTEETPTTPENSAKSESSTGTPKKSESEQTTDNISSILENWSSVQRPPGWTQFQLAPLSARLSQDGNFEDVLAALQDLENISNRKPNILDYFLDDLKILIQNRNLHCRQTAFNLLIKNLKSKPGNASLIVTAVLQCLENLEHDVIQTALQKLPEVVVLAQEYAPILLQKAFAVGISTNINSAPQICETLLLLNVQTGS